MLTILIDKIEIFILSAVESIEGSIMGLTERQQQVLNLYSPYFRNLNLRVVEKEDINHLHVDRKYHLIIKHEEVYLVGDVYPGYHIPTALAGHVCGKCCRLSGAPDDAENPGCAKVRAFSRHIEEFPFIRRGAETVGMKSTEFYVYSCYNWNKKSP